MGGGAGRQAMEDVSFLPLLALLLGNLPANNKTYLLYQQLI